VLAWFGTSIFKKTHNYLATQIFNCKTQTNVNIKLQTTETQLDIQNLKHCDTSRNILDALFKILILWTYILSSCNVLNVRPSCEYIYMSSWYFFIKFMNKYLDDTSLGESFSNLKRFWNDPTKDVTMYDRRELIQYILAAQQRSLALYK